MTLAFGTSYAVQQNRLHVFFCDTGMTQPRRAYVLERERLNEFKTGKKLPSGRYHTQNRLHRFSVIRD